MAKFAIGPIEEFPAGTLKVVTVKGREIVIINHDGEHFAMLNRCPHEGAKLCFGTLVSLVQPGEPGTFRLSRKGEILKCPWHGWEFDIRTGRSYCDPGSTFVRTYPVTIQSDDARIYGPYSAEIFEVSVADKYLMIEL